MYSATLRCRRWESHSLAGKQLTCISILYWNCGKNSPAITVSQNSPDPPCWCSDHHCVSRHLTLHHGRDYSNSDLSYLDFLTRELHPKTLKSAETFILHLSVFIIRVPIVVPTWRMSCILRLKQHLRSLYPSRGNSTRVWKMGWQNIAHVSDAFNHRWNELLQQDGGW